MCLTLLSMLVRISTLCHMCYLCLGSLPPALPCFQLREGLVRRSIGLIALGTGIIAVLDILANYISNVCNL